jgi:hypothetical protein
MDTGQAMSERLTDGNELWWRKTTGMQHMVVYCTSHIFRCCKVTIANVVVKVNKG